MMQFYKDLPATHFVLRKVPICEYSGAKRFPGEGPGFCCRKGKVNIFFAPIPDGETDWEDKSILLEQNRVIRFPRKKRSYTKRKFKCFVHLIFIFYFSYDADCVYRPSPQVLLIYGQTCASIIRICNHYIYVPEWKDSR